MTRGKKGSEEPPAGYRPLSRNVRAAANAMMAAKGIQADADEAMRIPTVCGWPECTMRPTAGYEFCFKHRERHPFVEANTAVYYEAENRRLVAELDSLAAEMSGSRMVEARQQTLALHLYGNTERESIICREGAMIVEVGEGALVAHVASPGGAERIIVPLQALRYATVKDVEPPPKEAAPEGRRDEA